MGLLQSYNQFLLKHPTKILIGGITLVLLLFLTTLLIRPLPSFKDPLVGFEVRNTLISARLNSWRLLLDETSASANNLSLIPNSPKYDGSYQSIHSIQPYNQDSNLPDPENTNQNEPPIIEMSTSAVVGQPNNNTILNNDMDEDEDEYYRTISGNNHPSQNDSSINLIHYSLGSSKAFCGKLYEGYAQFIITPSTRYSNSGLFNINSLLSICQLDSELRLEYPLDESSAFQRECERYQINASDTIQSTSAKTTCCNSWSLPNYVACLNNRTSCMDITAHDLRVTENLLSLCVPYYQRAPYEECFNQHKSSDVLPSMAAKAPMSSATSTLNLLAPTSVNGFSNRWSKPHCGTIPEKCLKCDGWIHTVMHYLVNENFIHSRFMNTISNDTSKSPNRSHKSNNNKHRPNNSIKDPVINRLSYTNIFLPMAKGSSLMKYYQSISKFDLKTPFAQVKAMDLGLKNSLFEHLISDDTKLFVIALVSVLFVISVYTWSLILSTITLLIICLSLCLSYTIYELVFNIPTFPFMNLLAVVISFGICSDNAMIFCKHWSMKEESISEEDENVDEVESNQNHHYQNGNGIATKIDRGQQKNNINTTTEAEKANLDRMLRKAVMSTLVATIATACSFIISAISQIIAVKCFCIFATLSVITNYLLIILLLPSALIMDLRFNEQMKKFLMNKGTNINYLCKQGIRLRKNSLKFEEILHSRWIFNLVTEYKFYFIITFLTLLSCSCILVFHKPTLQPSNELQLLSTKHSFEQYDKSLKRQFAFERLKSVQTLIVPTIGAYDQRFYDFPESLPIRIVFGVLPEDNGNHLDPHDRGTLTFDHKFDLADPHVQRWLLEFCHKLRNQRFVHPSSAPDLSNCFIDTFKSWMDTRSCRDPVQTDIDRSPCCQAYEFPYSRSTFDRCIGESIKMMRKTPQLTSNLNAGLRFFKNSTKVAALIIEYQSNRLFSESFTKMDRFFNEIDEWVTWQINNTAPASLKSGWFISSNLDLLALQTELGVSTINSILLEVLFAMLALMVGTRDLILTIAGSLTISTIIILTVASLILLKWTLGVAESILISLTIGLSIDFALHFSIAYSESRRLWTSDALIHKILANVGGPIALATVTTSLAGFVILWSDILAYQELGVFLLLIALISWLTSTFFLLPMLATVNSFIDQIISHARLVFNRIFKMILDRL